MSNNSRHQNNSTSLIGRILSMETFLFVMGVASLSYGITNDKTINIFWGIVIIPGVFILRMIRRKDWAKHWQDMEAEHTARLDFEARRKVAADEIIKVTVDEK